MEKLSFREKLPDDERAYLKSLSENEGIPIEEDKGLVEEYAYRDMGICSLDARSFLLHVFTGKWTARCESLKNKYNNKYMLVHGDIYNSSVIVDIILINEAIVHISEKYNVKLLLLRNLNQKFVVMSNLIKHYTPILKEPEPDLIVNILSCFPRVGLKKATIIKEAFHLKEFKDFKRIRKDVVVKLRMVGKLDGVGGFIDDLAEQVDGLVEELEKRKAKEAK